MTYPGRLPVALAVSVGLAALPAACTSGTEPADPNVGYREIVPVENPLRAELAATDAAAERYLDSDDNAYLKKAYVQEDSIFRYQVLFADFENVGNNAYTVRLANRRRVLDAVAGDAPLANVLRKASAVYIDVYDRDDAYFFSYDVTPGEIWE